MKALTFRSGEEWVGLRLDHVSRLVRVGRKIRRLLGAPPSIHGLVEVGGRVLTLLDTRILLGREASGSPRSEFAAILHNMGEGVGLLLPGDMEIRELGDELLDDERALDPYVEGVVATGPERRERVALLDPGVMLATCRDDVRSRFLTRMTA